jgi:hypothetical protein
MAMMFAIRLTATPGQKGVNIITLSLYDPTCGKGGNDHMHCGFLFPHSCTFVFFLVVPKTAIHFTD